VSKCGSFWTVKSLSPVRPEGDGAACPPWERPPGEAARRPDQFSDVSRHREGVLDRLGRSLSQAEFGESDDSRQLVRPEGDGAACPPWERPPGEAARRPDHTSNA